VLGYLHPHVLADLRVLGAVPIFFAAAMATDRRIPPKRDLLVLSLLGLLGVFANQLLYIEGLTHTTATNAGILMASMPVFTAAAATVLRVEKVRGLALVGIALAVGGALVMLDVSRLEVHGDKAFGNLLILSNCLAYALYVVVQRNIVHRMPPFSVAAWAYLFGGISVALVTTPALLAADLSTVPPRVWWTVVYIVLVPTTLNYALIAWSIRWSSPALVATYTTLQPVAAAVLAAIFLGESAGIREVLGFVLIIAGLFAVTRRTPAAQAPQA
jgi:drug/metabolite transporter (DMT)-like permease